MKANNSPRQRSKKLGGFLPALIHFILILVLGGGAGVFILFSGQLKADSFLSLLAALGVLLVLKLLMKPISKDYENFIVGTMYFTMIHSVTIVLPVIIYVVFHSITLAKGGLFVNSFGGIVIRLLLLAIFSGLYEENLRRVFYNMTYAKYYVKRYSFFWITALSVLISLAVQIAGFRLIFGAFPDWQILLFLGLSESYLALFYLRGSVGSGDRMDTVGSRSCRFFLTLLLFGPFCVFQNADATVATLPMPMIQMTAVITAILLIFVVAKRKELDTAFYDILKKWNIPEERLYNERDFVKNKIIFWRKNEDINISTYVIISIIAIALMFAVHFVLHLTEIVPKDCSLRFVRENGLDFIMTLISSTFLIVSFLSFLGDKDDKVLWTDMRSFRLINPPVFNFIGLSVFAFASLAAESVCYLFQYDYLFFVSFLAGMFFLVYLTFLVIISYFRRKETIDKLSEYAIATLFHPEDDFGDWQIISDELYENADRMIEDKNWSKLQEVYNHLIDMYNGIRNAQIREWIAKNGYPGEVRTEDNYAESFRAFARRCDCESNPLFTMVTVDDKDSKHKFALFDSSMILEELARIISLMDYRTLRLLLNRNKKSALVLQLLKPSVFEGMTTESGESFAGLIDSLCVDLLQKDREVLGQIVSLSQGGNRKRMLDWNLSIGTMTFDFPKRKGGSAGEEKNLIQEYMLELCKSGYREIIPAKPLEETE